MIFIKAEFTAGENMLQKNTLGINIQVGTSGYSYDDWRNVFYPPEIPKGQMLEFYCQFFQTVEINSTYYKIPARAVIQRLAEKAPAKFEFIIKTHQETTHRRVENAAAARQLAEAIQPLVDSAKFKGLLAQFPYSFRNSEANRHYLVETRKYFDDLPLFVEFRHVSWSNTLLPSFLKENNIGYVNVDEPNLPGLLPPQDIVTSDVGYIRLHGRNEKDWWQGEGSARYDYEYREEELKQWLTNLSQILKKTYKTYIYFNNHPKGQAIKNARQMIEIIKNQLQMDLS